MPRPAASSAIALALLAACSGGTEQDAQGPRQQPTPATQPLPELTHDFGVLRHGEVRRHDFVLDLRGALGPGWYAPGTHVDCSCAKTALLLRGPDGAEREIETYGPAAAPAAGEQLVVRVELDTNKREPVDTGVLESRVQVVLQPANARDPNARRQWPLRFSFQINSPVRLRPQAVLDFERVAPARPVTRTLALAGDEGHKVRFTNARCGDRRIEVQLEERDEMTLLRATVRLQPGDLGSLRSLIQIDTDLDPAYVVRLAAVAMAVPDLQAVPMPKLSLRDDLRQAQPPAKRGSQYLLVTDHDESRPADFVVLRLVDQAGRDRRGDFEVTFEAVSGEARSRRMHVRWIGAGAAEFRGQLVLGKAGLDEPTLPIELVALHDPRP